MFTVTRSPHNPILLPIKERAWEAAGAFNPSPLIVGKNTHILYRAFSEPDLLKEPKIRMSVVGHAVSKDGGKSYEDRRVLVSPSEDYDKYGCEDPRVTKFEGTHYIFYTGLGGIPFAKENIKVAVAISKDLKKVDEKHLVTPFNAKAMALFPERINGKMAALLTIRTDEPPSEICYAEFDKKEDIWSHAYWEKWQKNVADNRLKIRREDEDQIELGSAPIKTDRGWLVIYSHIQKYRTNPIFGIEAVLLDLDDPTEVIGRTKGPFLVPDAYYEHIGLVPNVIFPSGAAIRGEHLEVYYGGADTCSAVATIPLKPFLDALTTPVEKVVVRSPLNPILKPREGKEWESKGVLNPASVLLNKKIYILYRAVAGNMGSTIGMAVSTDGENIDEILPEPIYRPRAGFESAGCEDPRIIEIGKRLYMTYTGYDGRCPRVAVTSISTADFLARKWDKWEKPYAITPENVDDKDAVIFPEPFDGKYFVIHRIQGIICGDYVNSLDFSKEKVTSCIEILQRRPGMWDDKKVGISSQPIKTKEGWLILYHGISMNGKYRAGALLLDLKDPTIVLARTAAPILEPIEDYEKQGIVNNVVFPCGMVLKGKDIYIYYGGADIVTGVATVPLQKLLDMLKV